MENTIKISFSAVTHIGTARAVNENKVFANGRFFYPVTADYAQISLEVNDGKCFFALSEGMEDEESGISLTSDLKKFHQKAMASSKDIHVKLDDLVQCVEQTSNLLHSVSLGEDDIRERKPSFSGVLVDGGNIAAVNLGNCRIYKLEGDTFKLLVNDYKRAERLLKMGIISNEQAEILAGKQQTLMDEGRLNVKKSDVNPLREGTVYLICSNGLAEAVNEDIIYDIIGSNTGADEAASRLVEEAIKNDAQDNATALVIKVESAGERQNVVPGPRTTQYRSATSRIPSKQVRASASRAKSSIDVSRIISIVVLVFLGTAVLFGAFKMWQLFSARGEQGASTEQENTLEPEGTDNTTIPSGTVDETTNDDLPEDDLDTADPIADGAGDGTDDGTADIVNPSTTDAFQVGEEGVYYTVKSGDMLMVLAKKYYGDESKYTLIMEANKITDPNKITVGQKLFIPPAK